MEAIVFWSICKAALELSGCLSPVYVYGDDLILPSRHAKRVIAALHGLGLRVNVKKSFIHGHFRESCGVDAYHGVDATAPCRLKKRFPFRKEQARAGFSDTEAAPLVEAWIAYSNAFWAYGFKGVAENIRQRLASEYPKEHRYIVEKIRLNGHESYLAYLVDEVKHQPRFIDDVRYFSDSVDYINHLRFHGVTVGSRVLDNQLSRAFDNRVERYGFSTVYCRRSMEIAEMTNTDDNTSLDRLRIKGLSVQPETYYLRGEDHGFTDHHALFRWFTERCEDTRKFSPRNRCSLKIAEHPY
jgi:hypothetical protein